MVDVKKVNVCIVYTSSNTMQCVPTRDVRNVYFNTVILFNRSFIILYLHIVLGYFDPLCTATCSNQEKNRYISCLGHLAVHDVVPFLTILHE